MKKFLAIFALVFSVTSCTYVGEENAQTSESRRIIVKMTDSSENIIGGRQIQIIEFMHEGHQYFWMRDGNGQASCGGPVHDPNCSKCVEIREK